MARDLWLQVSLHEFGLLSVRLPCVGAAADAQRSSMSLKIV